MVKSLASREKDVWPGSTAAGILEVYPREDLEDADLPAEAAEEPGSTKPATPECKTPHIVRHKDSILHTPFFRSRILQRLLKLLQFFSEEL